MNVHWQDLRLQLPGFLLLRLWGLLILLDVELPQQHNRFLPEDATGDRVWLVDARARTG